MFVLRALMELRKAACHPLLLRVIYNDDKIKEMAALIMKESSSDTNFDYVVEDMSVMNDFELHNLCPLYTGLKGFELTNQEILDSGKFNALDHLLEEIKQADERVLIFSQFKIMLDIIEAYLNIKKHRFLRLDGSTKVGDRQDLIDDFKDDKDILVFLLTTKAGGVGINLAFANRVIMYDIDYNPQNDKQAEDRAHRVGQEKNVTVYKLIVKDSVDESMLKVQTKKLELDVDIQDDQFKERMTEVNSMKILMDAFN
jgi:SWI/SNF-related matrix-associated actin-dependent regulator 1 of chromatin subfamily A